MQQLLLWDVLHALRARLPDTPATPDSPRPPAAAEPVGAQGGAEPLAPRPLVSPDAPAAEADGAPQVSAVAPRVEFVRHPRARRYLIRVRLDGSVRVTIPSRGSKRDAVAFYEQQQGWIAEHQRRVAKVRASIPDDLPRAEQQALRERAKLELPARLRELAQVAGVSVRGVSVRNQRQRWGSCSASGVISLNWRLVTMPDWVRDYVLYHELMHRKQMDHSPAFWAHVASVCPNYRAARRWLRRHALAPHTPDAHRDTGLVGGDAAADAADDQAHGC